MAATTVPAVTSAEVADGLRRWARGAYAEEAAVELLARAFGGRFCSPGFRWVRRCDRPGWFWLDGEPLIHGTGALSGGERRVLAVAGALVSGSALADLPGIVAGLDRPNLQLVLAALAHAGGSHEHVEHRIANRRVIFRRLSPLVPWPVHESKAA